MAASTALINSGVGLLFVASMMTSSLPSARMLKMSPFAEVSGTLSIFKPRPPYFVS